MSDLISREEVIEVLKETGIIADNDLGHLVVAEIERIPVGYDVDKVVEELEEWKEIETLGDRLSMVENRFNTALDYAIDIVKGAVKDE